VHPKRTGQFISNVINLPAPTNSADAKLQIGIVMQYVRAGYATVEEGDKLIAHLKTFIDAEGIVGLAPRIAKLEAEAALRAEQGGTNVGIIVETSLPQLPGTESMIFPGTIAIESMSPDERDDLKQPAQPIGASGSSQPPEDSR
jgi:hypothetical protein